MLKHRLIHPEILRALGAAGHGSTVLLADANYPFSSGAHPSAPRVFLNFAPDLLRVTDVLSVLRDAIPIEAAHVMVPEGAPEPEILADFRAIIPEVPLHGFGRNEFYEAARSRDLALLIATGERRLYANILLTIGVVSPPERG